MTEFTSSEESLQQLIVFCNLSNVMIQDRHSGYQVCRIYHTPPAGFAVCPYCRNTEDQILIKLCFDSRTNTNILIFNDVNKKRKQRNLFYKTHYLDRVKRIWYLSPMRAARVQASLRIRAVSPEPSLLAHTSSESRGAFRQKARSLAPLNGWACAVKI